jgi:hypothetical protein
MLTVAGKNDQARLIPLHPTTLTMLIYSFDARPVRRLSFVWLHPDGSIEGDFVRDCGGTVVHVADAQQGDPVVAGEVAHQLPGAIFVAASVTP